MSRRRDSASRTARLYQPKRRSKNEAAAVDAVSAAAAEEGVDSSAAAMAGAGGGEKVAMYDVRRHPDTAATTCSLKPFTPTASTQPPASRTSRGCSGNWLVGRGASDAECGASGREGSATGVCWSGGISEEADRRSIVAAGILLTEPLVAAAAAAAARDTATTAAEGAAEHPGKHAVAAASSDAILTLQMSHWIGGDGTAGAADATREAAPPKEASATAAKAARPSNPAQPSAATLHPEESCILGTASTAAATAAAGVCGVEAQEAAAARATPDDSVPLDVIAVTDGQDITEAADISMAASSTAPIGSTLGAAKELFAHPAAAAAAVACDACQICADFCSNSRCLRCLPRRQRFRMQLWGLCCCDCCACCFCKSEAAAAHAAEAALAADPGVEVVARYNVAAAAAAAAGAHHVAAAHESGWKKSAASPTACPRQLGKNEIEEVPVESLPRRASTCVVVAAVAAAAAAAPAAEAAAVAGLPAVAAAAAAAAAAQQKGRCCLEDEVPSRMHSKGVCCQSSGGKRSWSAPILACAAEISNVAATAAVAGFRSSIRMAYDFVMRWLVGRGTLAGSGRAEFPLPHSSSSSGGRGDLPSFTPCQVYRHFLLGSLLLYANKKVYKINGLLGRHPGGDTCLLKHLAQDCTRDFLFHTRCGRCLWRGFLVGVSESCAGWTDSKQQRLAELKEQFLLQYMQKHQPDMQHEHSYQQSWLLLQQQQQAFKTLKDAGCNRCRPEKLGGLRAGEALAEDEDNRHMPEADA
ncbi:Holliday junction resolvase MOC1, chloroplastic [Cyclospora cayetanensis]|uniref:Holliday junction resolvase MOC1, chloroplastic n=1 Tax=Cyclospora cayetanensis TaxID=88456 RepID=A0A6P6S1L7_9EIME|nr:Holliday junction resolvase MOC1, chloroplastic [Cyclospora cayetanensis]